MNNFIYKYPDYEGGFVYKSVEDYNIVTRDNDFNLIDSKPVNMLKKGLETHHGRILRIYDDTVEVLTKSGIRQADKELFNTVLIKKSIQTELKQEADKIWEKGGLFKSLRNMMTIKPPKIPKTEQPKTGQPPIGSGQAPAGGPAWNAKGGQKPGHKYIERRPSPTKPDEWVYLYQLPNGEKKWQDQSGKELDQEQSVKAGDNHPSEGNLTGYKEGDYIKINSRTARVTDASDNLLAVRHSDGSSELITSFQLNPKLQKKGADYYDPQSNDNYKVENIGDNVFLARNSAGELRAFLKRKVFKLGDEQIHPSAKAKLDPNHYTHDELYKTYAKHSEAHGYESQSEDGLQFGKTTPVAGAQWEIERAYDPATKEFTVSVNGKKDFKIDYEGKTFDILDATDTDIVGKDEKGEIWHIDKRLYGDYLRKQGIKTPNVEQTDGLSENEQVLQHVTGADGPKTEKDISSATGIPVNRVKKHLADLLIDGKIRHKSGEYSLKDKPKGRWVSESRKAPDISDEERAKGEQVRLERVNQKNVAKNSESYKNGMSVLETEGYRLNPGNEFYAAKRVRANGLDFDMEAKYNKENGKWETGVSNGHYKEVHIGSSPDEKFKIADITDDTVRYYDANGNINSVSMDTLKAINGRNVFEPTSGTNKSQNIAMGKQTEIVYATGEKHIANYAVVELDDITASHDEKTFQPNKNYPQMDGLSTNDRDYLKNLDDQRMVHKVERNWDNRTINNSRQADQHIIISPENFVVSGNNRTMSAKLARESNPKAWEAFKQQMIDDASYYGLDPDAVAGMKHPFFVKIDSDFPKDENGDYVYRKSELAKFNADDKKAKTEAEEAMTYGDAIQGKPEIMDLLADAMKDKDTLSEILSSKQVSTQRAFRDVLFRSGVMPEQSAKKYFNPDGSFTDNGKILMRSVLKGTFLSPDTYELTTTEGMKKFGDAIVDNVGANSINASLAPEWSLQNYVNDAIRVEGQYQYSGDFKKNGSPFEQMLRMQDMFEPPHDRRTVALNLLAKKGPLVYGKLLKDYNQMASAEQSNNMDSMFGENVTPDGLFDSSIIDGEYQGRPVFTPEERKLFNQFKYETKAKKGGKSKDSAISKAFEEVMRENGLPMEKSIEFEGKHPRNGRGEFAYKNGSEIINFLNTHADKYRELELTPKNWMEEFGDFQIVRTPIGNVKIGDNQFEKLVVNKRQRYFGLIKPTLENPAYIVEVPDERKGAERQTILIFIKPFSHNNGRIDFTSITIKRDGIEISISNHEDKEKRIIGFINKGELLYKEVTALDSAGSEPPKQSTAIKPDIVDRDKDSKIINESQDKKGGLLNKSVSLEYSPRAIAQRNNLCITKIWSFETDVKRNDLNNKIASGEYREAIKPQPANYPPLSLPSHSDSGGEVTESDTANLTLSNVFVKGEDEITEEFNKSIDTTKNMLLPSKKNSRFKRWQRTDKFETNPYIETDNIIINDTEDIADMGSNLQTTEPDPINAVDFAVKYHGEQKYGGKPYVEAHLLPVFTMAKVLWQNSNHSIDFDTLGKVSFLHDVLEDTEATYGQVKAVFGKETADACELLNVKNKTKDEYYAGIAGNPLAKMVKTADRLVNLRGLTGLEDAEKRERLVNKYKSDFVYYEKYDINPDLIEDALDEL